jgi:hypothetical protein
MVLAEEIKETEPPKPFELTPGPFAKLRKWRILILLFRTAMCALVCLPQYRVRDRESVPVPVISC